MKPPYLIAIALMLVASTATAKSQFLNAAGTQYLQIVGTRLQSCSLCHSSVPNFNAYGRAYSNAGQNFTAIENADSDGDGVTNIAEIIALTFPGDSSDLPVAGEGEGEGEGEGNGCNSSVTKLDNQFTRHLADFFLLGLTTMTLVVASRIDHRP